MITFLDTNLLVYLFDTGSPDKRARALELFAQLSLSGEAILSTQVLQEFFVTVTRKLARPLPTQQAEQVVSELAALPLVPVDAELVSRAIALHRNCALSFWDALIVEAARVGGAERLLTEELQHGQIIGGVRIENPFLNG